METILTIILALSIFIIGYKLGFMIATDNAILALELQEKIEAVSKVRARYMHTCDPLSILMEPNMKKKYIDEDVEITVDGMKKEISRKSAKAMNLLPE